MTKGKFGIAFKLTALVAFLFALFNQPIAVLLIVGFAALAEKNDGLTRQTLQALLLNLAYYLTAVVVNIFFDDLIGRVLIWLRDARVEGVSEVINVVNEIQSATLDLLYCALIVFSVIAIIRVLCGKDARVPLLSKLVGGETAKKAPKPAPAPEAPAETTASVAVFCSACGEKLANGTKFCPKCGNKLD